MILIALGANLSSRFGAPEETLAAAADVLAERGILVVSSSSVWFSAPVPVSEQPWYRNGVIAAQTDLQPLALLKTLKAIEADFGREDGARNAPRVLDLDILAYHDEILSEEGCIIPHPRLSERAFVLYPLQEIAEEWIHPVSGLSAGEMIQALPEGQEIEKLDGEMMRCAA